jgi:tRNA-2-methylthio-N6-dimethylallyladenosine synthase
MVSVVALHRTPLVVGVLGCMAERLKSQLLDQQKLADLVVGPDAYRDLPRIIAAVQVRLAAAPSHLSAK